MTPPNLSGYDAWKLECPYDMTAEQEAELQRADQEAEDAFREVIAATLSDERRGIYLATIRKIVIEEVNKLAPTAGEPARQTRMQPPRHECIPVTTIAALPRVTEHDGSQWVRAEQLDALCAGQDPATA